MSTNGYLLCLTHEPNVISGEVGNFSYDSTLKRVRDLIRDRVKIVVAYKILDDQFDIYMGDMVDGRERAALSFLVDHPQCEIGIIDEYRKRYPLTEDGPLNHIRYKITGFSLCSREHGFTENPIVFDQNEDATPCGNCVDILQGWIRSW